MRDRNNNMSYKGGKTMTSVIKALRATITAIETDPLAWAKVEEEEFLALYPNEAPYATRATEEELLASAAEALEKARKRLAEEEAKPAPESVDMARLVRANERTKRAMRDEGGY